MPIDGLSKLDSLFIDEYFNNGFNGTAAYRKVFKLLKQEQYASAKFGAYRLLNKPIIKHEVESRWDEIKGLNIIKREEIIIALKELMVDSINNQDNQTLLKTIDTINKMQGHYTTLIDANINQSILLHIPGLEPDEDEDDKEE